MTSAYSLTPYTKVNGKWTKDLAIRMETIKLLSKMQEINLTSVLEISFWFDTEINNHFN